MSDAKSICKSTFVLGQLRSRLSNNHTKRAPVSLAMGI